MRVPELPVTADPVDKELFWIRGGGRALELVDVEHELHRVVGGLLDFGNELVVEVEVDAVRGPVSTVSVEVGYISS